MTNISKAVLNAGDPDRLSLYLKLLAPPRMVRYLLPRVCRLLGPLLGDQPMALMRLTLSNPTAPDPPDTAQPVYRDSVINAKFVASLIVVSTLFLSLNSLMIAWPHYYRRRDRALGSLYAYPHAFVLLSVICM